MVSIPYQYENYRKSQIEASILVDRQDISFLRELHCRGEIISEKLVKLFNAYLFRLDPKLSKLFLNSGDAKSFFGRVV